MCYNYLISLCLGGRDALFRSLIVKTSESSVHYELDDIGMISVCPLCPNPLSTSEITSSGFIQGTASVLRTAGGLWLGSQREDQQMQEVRITRKMF